MKRILFLTVIAGWPVFALAQDTINPYNTQQSATIELHGKLNVYYKPYYPPAPDEPLDSICSVGPWLLDSDGTANIWPYYQPWVRGEGEMHDTALKDWKPYGTPLGMGVPWQRFFTAKRDASGNPHDIIAGGNPGDSVIISKNEDVDFRASGTIKLKSGFHAMPGCRFHAYTEPRYDSVVLSDNFDSINHAKWYIANGDGDGYGTLAECSSDTSVRDTADPEALDGHALDIFMYEDTCECYLLDYEENDSCNGTILKPRTVEHALFKTAIVRACPFPYLRRDTLPLVPAYQQAPYGKYEIREKIAHLPHHTNNWLSTEIDINESAPPNLNYLFPNIHSSAIYGPFKGKFHKAWNGWVNTGDPLIDSVIFVSHDADWTSVNAPTSLLINNVAYEVWIRGHDTTALAPRSIGYMGWPASLANDTTDSVTFYYARNGSNTADTTTWNVRQDSHGIWRVFYAPYHDSSGHWLTFSKAYQPTQLTLKTNFFLPPKTYHCHWEYNLNPPSGSGDSGILYLDDTLAPTDLHSKTEAYSYSVDESGSASPLPAFPFDLYDTTGDYTYHTFAVEVLPHELRYLVDSNVVCRLPDRLISPNHQKYRFFISQAPADLRIGQFDMDGSDPFGLDSTSITYQEKQYFEQHPNNPGFRDVTIGGKAYHAAHDLIDYVRVWTVPKDVSITNYPK